MFKTSSVNFIYRLIDTHLFVYTNIDRIFIRKLFHVKHFYS